MVISLYTNLPGFANDIADELRLFTDAAVCVCTDEAEAMVSVCLYTAQGWYTAIARGRLLQGEASYTYRCEAVQGSALAEKRYQKRAVKIAAFRMMRQLSNTQTPWGSLTGIRPTHLLRELMEDMGPEAAEKAILEDFDVQPEKYALCREIVEVQRPIFESLGKRDVDVYIGIPFCRTRCLYCSFAAELRTEKTDMDAYLRALKRDIALGAALVREGGFRLRSLYVGGGTPTVLKALELEALLAHAMDCYGGFGTEFTVEAGRPDTMDREKLALLKRLCVSRISINPQSMNPATLDRIGRDHGPAAVRESFALARELGFSNINMDIISALPGEDLSDINNTLAQIEALGPESLTVHTLAVKRSSRLKERLEEYPLPDAKTAEAMVDAGRLSARRMGMQPYYMYRQKYMRGNLENVGYAKPGAICIYNVDMMEESCAIMAHGAGAMSKRVFDREQRVERIPNPKDIATYISKVEILGEEKRRLFLEA